MSRGICTNCKSKDNYNFVINNGLCNPCIAERLDELEAELAAADRQIGWLKGDKVRLNKSVKIRDNAMHALMDHMDDKKEKQLQAELDTASKRIRRLHDALQNLYDEQNGVPLLHHEATWQAAMEEAEKLLKRKP